MLGNEAQNTMLHHLFIYSHRQVKLSIASCLEYPKKNIRVDATSISSNNMQIQGFGIH